MTRWLKSLPEKIRDRVAAIGLLDPRRVASAKPLTTHLADYEQTLGHSGATLEYVQKTVSRVTASVEGTGATFRSDLSAAAVSRFLTERRGDGLSVKTSNHYLTAAKGFVNWLVKERRASDHPIAHLSAMNAKANREHVRRSLEPDELRALLSAARAGPERHGMSGEERYWLYRMAVESGL